MTNRCGNVDTSAESVRNGGEKMPTKMPLSLIIISIVAILMDCYTGRVFFLMLAMPIGFYLSPILLLAIVLFFPAIFISSIIGLFRLKRWGYYIFFTLTFIFSFLLLLRDIEYLVKKYITLGIPQIFLMVFFLTFTIYFLKPSTRKLFGRKKNDVLYRR